MKLYYFTVDEFLREGTDWSHFMSPRLLVLLDTLRHRWGQPIRISPAVGAIGRRAQSDLSQHNIDAWGEVRAVDVMPEGLTNEMQVALFRMMAEELGFTGIGFYPHWEPAPGFHLDVREDRSLGDPATWGGVRDDGGRQIYVSIGDAMEAFA